MCKSLGLIPNMEGKGKEDTHLYIVMYVYQKVSETHPFLGVQECMLIVIAGKSKNTLIV